MDAAEVFRTEDFKSVQIVITFQNLTTRTEIKDKSRISLIEVAERELMLEAPGKSCSPRHNVMIRIERPARKSRAPIAVNSERRSVQQKEFELLFSATGKVTEVEDTGEGCDKVCIELVQFDLDTWKRFTDTFSSRQEDIEKFFAAARG